MGCGMILDFCVLESWYNLNYVFFFDLEFDFCSVCYYFDDIFIVIFVDGLCYKGLELGFDFFGGEVFGCCDEFYL